MYQFFLKFLLAEKISHSSANETVKINSAFRLIYD